MRTVAAFLLCVLGGNATPSADDVSKVITAVGGEADADSISKLLKDMEGKDVSEVIAAGQAKLANVSMGGGGGDSGGASAGGAAGGAAAAAPAVEEKEEEEEVDMGGGMDMFGGGEGGGDY